MDMQMPVMGGIEAAKLYQFTTPLESRAPIVILTANATTEAKRECEEAKVTAYLTKPIVAKRLMSTINSICADSCKGKTTYEYIPDNNSGIDTSCNTEPLLSLDILSNVKDLSSDELFIHELITVFIGDSKKLLAAMESAVASKDNEAYLENVHALKGSAGSIGAHKLFLECKETLSQGSNRKNYVDSLKTICLLFTQTEDALSHFMQNSCSHSDQMKARL
jgi:two-component system sensor histidine kinase RpfC